MCRVLLKLSRCGRQALLFEPWRQQQDLEFEIEAALALVGLVLQIGKRRRVALRPRWLRRAERRERLGRDDPRRDGGSEVLGQERAERLVLPGLDVARRPVVQQAEAGDMLARLADRDRLAERVARARSRRRAPARSPAARHGPKLGAGSSGRLRWPFGRRIGVPEGTTDEARP